MKREIFIGDVHGCFDQLSELWKKLEIQEGDKVYFVGDIIDRGPASSSCLTFLRDLSKTPNWGGCVLGNHELKAIRRYYKRAEVKDWHGSEVYNLTPEELIFIETFPFMIQTAYTSSMVVHAGIPPKSLNLTVEKDSFKPYSELIRDKKRLKYISQLAFCRNVNKEGNLIKYDPNNPTEGEYWALQKDPKWIYPVISGHNPFLKPGYINGNFTIDTGCCFGNKLTAMVLHELWEFPEEPKYIQVDGINCGVKANLQDIGSL